MPRLGDKLKLHITNMFPKSDNDHAENIRSINDWADRLGRWEKWTPTITQGVTPTQTINWAKYTVIGDMVVATARITFGSAGTAANSIFATNMPTLPNFTAQTTITNWLIAGVFMYQAGGTTNYQGAADFFTPTQLEFTVNASTAGFGINPAVTIANNDILNFHVVYEGKTL